MIRQYVQFFNGTSIAKVQKAFDDFLFDETVGRRVMKDLKLAIAQSADGGMLDSLIVVALVYEVEPMRLRFLMRWSSR